MRDWRLRRGVGALVAGVLLVTGCGASSAPGEDVPALARALDRVDEAIVAGRYEQARDELNALVETASQAREAEELEDAEADRILAAAAQLISALPATGTRSNPVPSQPAPTTHGSPTQEQDEEEKLEEERKKLEEERKKLEKELKKDENGEGGDDEGGGNGDSSENGPDDGEGN